MVYELELLAAPLFAGALLKPSRPSGRTCSPPAPRGARLAAALACGASHRVDRALLHALFHTPLAAHVGPRFEPSSQPVRAAAFAAEHG